MYPQLVSGSASSISGTNPPSAQNNNVNNWICTFSAYQGWSGGGGTGWASPATACHAIIHKQHAPGFNLGSAAVGPSGWTVDHIFAVNGTINSPGISQGIGMGYTKAGVGDSVGQYIYHWNYGGATAPSDEGNSIVSLQGGESNSTYAATISTGGVGATALVTSCTNDCGNQGDGRYLIDTQTPIATGTISAYTSPSGFTPGTLTVSATVTASTFWGTLNADIATPMPATLGTGSTSETFVVNKVGGSSPSAGDLICFAGQFHEQAKIASVTGTGPYTITANLRHAHESGSWVMDGWGCSTFIELTANDSIPGSQLIRYPFDIIGATGPHTLVYRWFQYGSGSDSLSAHVGAFSAGVSGQDGFNLWAGAEVLDVNDGSGNVNGHFTLEPNTVSWNTSDTVEEPHHYASKNFLEFNNVYIDNPAGSYAGGVSTAYSGAGISGGGWWGWGSQFAAYQTGNNNPASMYANHGGYLSAPNFESVTGLWGARTHQYAPEGGPAFYYGCPYAGCSGTWWFLDAQSGSTGDQHLIGVDAANGNPVFGAAPEFQDVAHSTNHVICWKSSTQIGACSTQPDSSGACNCSLP